MRIASKVRHYVNEGARRIVEFDLKNKRDVTRMRYTRKSLNCTAHAGDDQNNGGHVESNPANDRAHTIRYPVIFIDQWLHAGIYMQNLANTCAHIFRFVRICVSSSAYAY